jgi:hypothetical protein
MRTLISLAVCCLLSGLASGQTLIQDTLYLGTGTTFQGKIVIISPDMRTASGRTVVRARTELDVSNGQISLSLEPNDSSTPSGTYYVVQYFPRRGQSWSEQWIVPSSAAPLKVSEVRVLSSGGLWPVPPPAQQQINFADSEVPIGSVDGSNRTFQLAFQPSPPTSLILTRNGLVMKRGLDYTLAGKTVTFIVEQTPQVGDIILAWYRY